MAKTREIKKRIKTVGNIRRITKTMQMIASSKFARAQQAAVASKPFTETIFELVTQLSANLGSDVTHPLLEPAKAGRPLTLIITSERGLCGPYNGSVLRAAMQLVKGTPGVREGLVELVGKKGAGFLKFSGIPMSRQHNQFGDKPTYALVKELADEYIRMFLAGEISTVRIVSMKYISAGRQAPTVLQLLPFETPKVETVKTTSTGVNAVYEFSPSGREILDDLLPTAVRAVLFQVFNDAIVSEHVARMVAMKAATDNAGKMGKFYTRKFNRARQAQITTELTEIISGAAALA
ncbi:MAG: ATP synthase F1 subunit gamma [bacterium]|nr:ATP synthase F1 subunit gamma [bacterium]